MCKENFDPKDLENLVAPCSGDNNTDDSAPEEDNGGESNNGSNNGGSNSGSNSGNNSGGGPKEPQLNVGIGGFSLNRP